MKEVRCENQYAVREGFTDLATMMVRLNELILLLALEGAHRAMKRCLISKLGFGHMLWLIDMYFLWLHYQLKLQSLGWANPCPVDAKSFNSLAIWIKTIGKLNDDAKLAGFQDVAEKMVLVSLYVFVFPALA